MWYPIHLNLDEVKVTIIGGGTVAFRRCLFFLSQQKEVKVVAKQFIPAFEEVRGQLTLICGEYEEAHLQDSFLVIAATDNRELNRRIGTYCRQNQKLVNVVDDFQLSNFIVPATVKRGDLLLSVATGGKSPALAMKIKKDLEGQYGESYGTYVQALGEMREKILATESDATVKRKRLTDLLNLTLEELEDKIEKHPPL